MRRVFAARLVLALGTGCALAGGCSLLLDFSERPHGAGGSGGGGGADAGALPPPVVGAFDLDDCKGAQPSPLSPQACDYRDQSCSGFADLSETYVVKPASASIPAGVPCARAAFVAYEWSPPGEPSPELRILARKGPGGDCAAVSDAGSPGERLVIYRVDAETLALKGETAVRLVAGGVPIDDAVPLVLGRSERRLVAAFVAGDSANGGAPAIYIATVPIDVGDAVDPDVPKVLAARLVAKLKVSSKFTPTSLTAVDDATKGKLFVAVYDAPNTAQVATLADENATETIAYSNDVKFGQGTTTAKSEHLFPRTTATVDDAGAVHVAREGPAAILEAETPTVTVMSDSVVSSGLGALRYLMVAGATQTISRATPWYSAAAIAPASPGPSFGENPNYTRLDLFSLDGKSYFQLRSCADADHSSCAIGAAYDGGPGDLSKVGIASCDGPVPFDGAIADAGVSDGKGYHPTIAAVCELGAATLGSGTVVWHRVAGAMGAAIEAGGGRVWLVRPGGAEVTMSGATLAPATSIDPGPTVLSDSGPIGVTFVNPLGWIVSALEKDTGNIWLRRYGCPALP